MLTESKKNKKKNKIKFNPEKMDELIQQAHLGDEVINFKDLVLLPRLRSSFVIILSHYLHTHPQDDLSTDQLDELTLLHRFLETI